MHAILSIFIIAVILKFIWYIITLPLIVLGIVLGIVLVIVLV